MLAINLSLIETRQLPFHSDALIYKRFINLFMIITTKIPLGLVIYRSIPGMTAIFSNDGLATTAHRSHVPQTCALCDSVPFIYDKLL